jgi:DNA-binding IclR family transcriptional regulator
VFRILHTLEKAGFVERVGEGNSYKLSIGVLRLGFEYMASMELTEHGRSVIEALRDVTGYSAHLVVRDRREVVFVVKATGRSALFHSIQVGARLPAYATVLGRQLLANLDMGALEELYPETPLPAHTPKTPTTLKQLKALIDIDRANGYGISEGGFETGISTIAAPVLNDAHEVVAAVSITVPAQHLAASQTDVLVPQVKAAAAQPAAEAAQARVRLAVLLGDLQAALPAPAAAPAPAPATPAPATAKPAAPAPAAPAPVA